MRRLTDRIVSRVICYGITTRISRWGKKAWIKNISLFARKLVSRGRGEFIEGIFRFVLGDPSIPINHRRDICTVKPYATETCVYKGLFHLVTWPAHVTGPVLIQNIASGPFSSPTFLRDPWSTRIDRLTEYFDRKEKFGRYWNTSVSNVHGCEIWRMYRNVIARRSFELTPV